MQIMSNQDAEQLGIYGAVAGVGIAAGAALAVRGTSGIYRNKDKKKAKNVTEPKTIKLAEPTQEQYDKWRKHNEKIKAAQQGDPAATKENMAEWRAYNEKQRDLNNRNLGPEPRRTTREAGPVEDRHGRGEFRTSDAFNSMNDAERQLYRDRIINNANDLTTIRGMDPSTIDVLRQANSHAKEAGLLNRVVSTASKLR